MNQTAVKGKNPQGLNPIGILSKSFESKEAQKILVQVQTTSQQDATSEQYENVIITKWLN
jgi:hypothetical protein